VGHLFAWKARLVKHPASLLSGILRAYSSRSKMLFEFWIPCDGT
jgi:hypothetical protein